MAKDYQPLLRRLLRPVVRFCLRRSLKIQDVVSALKAEFVARAAEEILQGSDTELSVSKLSAVTGLQRKHLSKLENLESPPSQASRKSNLVTRLIGQWLHDRRFSRGGKPRDLTTTGVTSEFAALLRALSADLNHHTMLFELERLGLIERINDKARLLVQAYSNAGKPEEALGDAAQDLDDLFRAVDHNITLVDQDPPHLHARTTFDNIPADKLPKLRRWLFAAGSTFHRRVSDMLARYDRDTGEPAEEQKGRVRLVFGSFSFSEQIGQGGPRASREKKK